MNLRALAAFALVFAFVLTAGFSVLMHSARELEEPAPVVRSRAGPPDPTPSASPAPTASLAPTASPTPPGPNATPTGQTPPAATGGERPEPGSSDQR